MAAVKHITVMIGGSDGHDQSTRARADLVLGLSALTLQRNSFLKILLALMLMTRRATTVVQPSTLELTLRMLHQ